MKKKINFSNYNYLIYNKIIKQRYHIENELEAGIVLYGWEVKSIRLNRINITDSYVSIKENEAYLFNMNIQPLTYTKFYFNIIKQDRIRKLLLNKYEINLLNKYINRHRYTVAVLAVFCKNNWIKIKIAIAKGKTDYDKRVSLKKREWQINKNRILKFSNKKFNRY